jgi:ribosomal protein L37AE/L43A
MSNVKSATNCPKCKTKGVLRGKRGLLLKLECSSCEFKWQTLFTSLRGGLRI